MKNIIKIILSLLVLASFSACTDADNTIDEVLNFEAGAVLRTLSVDNNTLNSSNPASFWAVTVEEQDVQDGALLKSVSVYVSIRDLTAETGTTVANDAFVKTIDASAFTTGPLGLPRASISTTFGEAESAMGLSGDDTTPGDLYVFELRLELTDGRIFGASSAAGIITGGFFSSPFKYNALVVCSPEPGDYRVEMVDNYGDGWQGDIIRVHIDDTDVDVTLPSYWDADPATRGSVGDPQWTNGTAIVNIPVGTELGTWEYLDGDFPSEVEFEIFAPDGTSFGYFGPSASPGLLPVLKCAGTL
jgi:hypothetical protein